MHDDSRDLSDLTPLQVNIEAHQLDPDRRVPTAAERAAEGKELFLGELPLGVEPGSADDPRIPLGRLMVDPFEGRGIPRDDEPPPLAG